MAEISFLCQKSNITYNQGNRKQAEKGVLCALDMRQKPETIKIVRTMPQ